MFKNTSLGYFVLFLMLAVGVGERCSADVSGQLAKADAYKDNEHYIQAEGIYKAIVTDYPGTDYALKAQKELVILYILMKRDSEAQTSLDRLAADFSEKADLPAARWEIAKRYEQSWKYNEAKSIYQNIIYQHPQSSYAIRSQLGIPKADILSFIRSGQESAATSAIENLLNEFSKNPYLPEALENVAYQYRRFKKYDRAIGLYQYIVDNYPSSEQAMWAQMGVAKSNVECGKFGAAKPAVDKLLGGYLSHPDLPTAIHYIAQQYRKGGKYSEARNLYQEIIKRYPNTSHSGNARIEVAQMDILLLIEAGNYTAAQTVTDKLLADFREHPRLPEALYNIADRFEDAGKYEQSKGLYQQIAVGFPGFYHSDKVQLEVPKSQIFIYIDAGEHTKALEAINKLISDYANHPYLSWVVSQVARHYYERANQMEKQGNTGQALEHFRKSAAIYERVIAELPKAPASDVVPDAYCRAGDCYRKLGEYEKSVRCYQKVVDDYPWYNLAWHALFMVGRNYEEMGERGLILKSEADQKTRAAYQQLVEKYPSCSAASHAGRWLSHHNSN